MSEEKKDEAMKEEMENKADKVEKEVAKERDFINVKAIIIIIYAKLYD